MSRIGDRIESTRWRLSGSQARSATIRSSKRERLRDDPAEAAVQVELLGVLDRLIVAGAEDPLAREVDLQDDQEHVERNDVAQDRAATRRTPAIVETSRLSTSQSCLRTT